MNTYSFQIHDVIALKEIVDYFADVKRINEFQLLKQNWVILTEIHDILIVPFKATIELQKRNLILSDVFGIWLKMKLHLQAILSAKKNYKTDLATHLLQALDKRKTTIFSNPFMSCSMFLDPRYRNQITNDEIKVNEAKALLENIYRRLKAMKPPDSNNAPMNVSFKYNSDEELDKYLNGASSDQANSSVQVQQVEDISTLLDLFNPPVVGPKTDILAWWQKEKSKNEVLYELATVTFAIPPTEVQIERDFSKLCFVFNKLRYQLTEQRLDDIMVINLNSDLFYDVKEEEILALKNKAEQSKRD